MKFKSIKELNLFINEFDEVDFVSKRDEVEFLELLNKELENYKITIDGKGIGEDIRDYMVF